MANEYTQTSLADLRPVEVDDGDLYVMKRAAGYSVVGTLNRPTDQELTDNELPAMRKEVRQAIKNEAANRMKDEHTGVTQYDTYDLVDQVFRTLINIGTVTRPQVNNNMPPELNQLRLIDKASRDMLDEVTTVCVTVAECDLYIANISTELAVAPRTIDWPAAV